MRTITGMQPLPIEVPPPIGETDIAPRVQLVDEIATWPAGTEVAAVRVYNRLMGSNDISGAAATALILALVLCAFLLIYFTLQKKPEGEQ